MSVEYPIKSLAARVNLRAIQALHGQVITKDLTWTLSATHNDKIHTSHDAQASLNLHAGTYLLAVSWGQRQFDFGEITLRRSYCRDIIISLYESGEPNGDEEGYFVNPDEVSKQTEHARRSMDRNDQTQFGLANGELADPNPPQGEMGQGFASHPLLDSAQFDGVAPEVSSQPEHNTEAVQKQIQHLKQAQMQNMPSQAPTPTMPG